MDTKIDIGDNFGCVVLCLIIAVIIIAPNYFNYQAKILEHQSEVCATAQAK